MPWKGSDSESDKGWVSEPVNEEHWEEEEYESALIRLSAIAVYTRDVSHHVTPKRNDLPAVKLRSRPIRWENLANLFKLNRFHVSKLVEWTNPKPLLKKKQPPGSQSLIALLCRGLPWQEKLLKGEKKLLKYKKS